MFYDCTEITDVYVIRLCKILFRDDEMLCGRDLSHR